MSIINRKLQHQMCSIELWAIITPGMLENFSEKESIDCTIISLYQIVLIYNISAFSSLNNTETAVKTCHWACFLAVWTSLCTSPSLHMFVHCCAVCACVCVCARLAGPINRQWVGRWKESTASDYWHNPGRTQRRALQEIWLAGRSAAIWSSPSNTQRRKRKETGYEGPRLYLLL